MVLADVPPERKPERGYIRMFPGTKTGTRVRSDVPPKRKRSPCASAEARRWFFFIFRRETWWEIWRVFCGFFLTHTIKAQKFREKFRSSFRTKIRSSKNIFRAKFTLHTCHLKKTGMRVRSPKPPFYETALLSPMEWNLLQALQGKTDSESLWIAGHHSGSKTLWLQALRSI